MLNEIKLMKKLLLLTVLFPILAFGQTDKGKYTFTEAATLLETTIVDECVFRHLKVELFIHRDGGQKIDVAKGKYANERLKKCNLKTKTTNWTVGSTEVKFQDRNRNAYWIYVDNDKLNFHDWAADKSYVLYLRVLEGPNRLMFLDDIEATTAK
jgi:hypothetical protein